MTTQTQFETAACPPTPVRRLEPDEDTKTLLVPTDFSRGSRHAAQTAVTLARAIGARIEFLHVRNVAEFVGSLPMGGMPDFHAMDPLRPEDTEAMWQRFLFATDGLDQVDYERRTSIGHPVSAILARADELDAEMIVMGASRCPRLLRWDVSGHHQACGRARVVLGRGGRSGSYPDDFPPNAGRARDTRRRTGRPLPGPGRAPRVGSHPKLLLSRVFDARASLSPRPADALR